LYSGPNGFGDLLGANRDFDRGIGLGLSGCG
jgi:hypothetical protein